MSETPTPARPDALADAGEVAHWVVLFLGWLWLGQQGMRLGWSLASGVLPVALWWAVRILARGTVPAWAASSGAMAVLGGLTVLGVQVLGLPLSAASAQWVLFALAVCWGGWTAVIETRSPTSSFELSRFAWHPVLAAALVWALGPMTQVSSTSDGGAVALLTLSAVLLPLLARRGSPHADPCGGPRGPWFTLLAPSAMGLMMGSLWLGSEWCQGLGMSTAQMVNTHLWLMAGLPSGVAWGLGLRSFGRWSASAMQAASLCCLFSGALMLWGNSLWQGALAMLLPVLAWAMHCARPRGPKPTAAHATTWSLRSTGLLLGPGLLMGVGLASPTQGPWAMQLALALLGALAGGAWAHMAWRRPRLGQVLTSP